MTGPELQAVLVEDHLALRKGLELLLRDQGIRIVGVAETPAAGIRIVLARKPDVAIVDMSLEDGSGIEVAREVLAREPGTGILFYTGSTDQALLQEALDSGARGFALKAGGPSELLTAVRVVAAGGEYVDPRVARLLDAGDVPQQVLSPREREVIDLLAGGLKGEEVAERLFLSPETVQTHVRNLMRKLGARTRVHALAIAIKQREIEVG
jgi:DNA-binding NarL/FixJ family response regulator